LSSGCKNTNSSFNLTNPENALKKNALRDGILRVFNKKSTFAEQENTSNIMPRIAIFPGSFDPITRGHENVILRALPLFDKIIIGLGENSEKKSMFSIEQRIQWIHKTFAGYPSISVESYSGLTVNFCRQMGAGYIIRGLRTSADFEFERCIGQVNKVLHAEIETVFFLSLPEFSALNSSVVRDVIKHGGNPDSFIPEKLKNKVRAL
jgi:pantetheine-phosphate adenylyltransferase